MRRCVPIVVALLLVGAILLLNAYIYSPLHVHDRFSGQACSLCQFAHCVSLQAAAQILIVPPAALLWGQPDDGTAHTRGADRHHRSGRAPPRSPLYFAVS